ncbi:MAG: 4Fe-4S binding protein [Bacteroidales bacterium]|nr:4Fe-4S binding protein [Bacteroidales bacterium]MBN2758559.1 4Fe-4S binding protein [Bacteroidales bacterium]
MKKLYSYNFISRIIFLLLTPVFFQYFGLGFIWHSIYWGVITAVVLIWGAFIIFSPLVGRIGCGWFCFMGTVSDLSSQHSIFKIKWRKPKIWIRMILLIPFFASAIIFYFINKERGITHDFAFLSSFLKLDFSLHYQYVWIIDVTSALLFGLLLERRWACKNICIMGTLCSAGANYSRLIPVVDINKCTLCGKCEKDCLVRIPIIDYINNNNGLITNSECILCGKCVELCKFDAIKIKFIWNRNKYKQLITETISLI